MFERSLARVLWTLPTRLIGLKFLAFTAPSFFRMSAIEVAFKNLSNEPLSWKYRKNFAVSSFTTIQLHWNKAIKNSLGPRALSPFIPCKACYVSSSSNSHSSCSTSTALASIELNCWDYVFCLRLLSTWHISSIVTPMHDVVESHMKPTS